jgi:hypothetical protein
VNQVTINTRSVEGRRTVRYPTYDELLKDAERIATSDQVETLGNWSVGQIFKHLADAIESSIDGSGFVLPWPIRVVFTMLMKRKYLYDSLPAGFKAPKRFQPEPIDAKEALDALRSAIGRVNSETDRVMHPAFGQITREEWDQFNLRHCEMHMSFIKG